jgi:penicillin amidase
MLRYPTAAWFGEDGAAARDAMLVATLEEALDELTTALGEDMEAWRWGALHTARFAHPLAILPGLEALFVGGEPEVGGDEQTVHQGLFEPGAGYHAVVIPSWRHIIDLSDVDASVGMHTTGQSGNPASPHYRDFVEPWSKVEYHPLPFTRAKVEQAAESELKLLPEAGDSA